MSIMNCFIPRRIPRRAQDGAHKRTLAVDDLQQRRWRLCAAICIWKPCTTGTACSRRSSIRITTSMTAGAVFIGADAVRRYFQNSRTPFPDQGNEIIAIAATGDTVLVEFWLTGTHLGPLRRGDRTIAPTGRAFRVRMAATFAFKPGSDKIVCERPISTQPQARSTGRWESVRRRFFGERSWRAADPSRPYAVAMDFASQISTIPQGEGRLNTPPRCGSTCLPPSGGRRR